MFKKEIDNAEIIGKTTLDRGIYAVFGTVLSSAIAAMDLCRFRWNGWIGSRPLVCGGETGDSVDA